MATGRIVIYSVSATELLAIGDEIRHKRLLLLTDMAYNGKAHRQQIIDKAKEKATSIEVIIKPDICISVKNKIPKN